MNEKKLRKLIRELFSQLQLFENNGIQPDELEEERITNPESKEFVKKRENFIGSHIFGEDIGGLNKMYVAYSYGEQFPVYLYHNGKWYHNYEDYLLPDGTANPATDAHKKDMQPSKNTIGISTKQIQSLINNFKRQNGIGEIEHKSVEPGEKN